jgi:hypothetical protein
LGDVMDRLTNCTDFRDEHVQAPIDRVAETEFAEDPQAGLKAGL